MSDLSLTIRDIREEVSELSNSLSSHLTQASTLFLPLLEAFFCGAGSSRCRRTRIQEKSFHCNCRGGMQQVQDQTCSSSPPPLHHVIASKVEVVPVRPYSPLSVPVAHLAPCPVPAEAFVQLWSGVAEETDPHRPRLLLPGTNWIRGFLGRFPVVTKS